MGCEEKSQPVMPRFFLVEPPRRVFLAARSSAGVLNAVAIACAEIQSLGTANEDPGRKHQRATQQNLDGCRDHGTFHVPVADPGDGCKLC